MRIIINLLLIAVIAGLVYVLIGGIREPIKFIDEKSRRERVVIDKLMTIRKTQELYRDITGHFAPTFDTLAYVLRNGRFKIIQVYGDPDDPTGGEITYDTIFKPAFDSIKALGINLDSLKFVPFADGASFDIDADTLTYQSTVVDVVQVGTPRKVFMGPFADPRFAKYDKAYDPNKPIKFGDMSKPNLSGNWEN